MRVPTNAEWVRGPRKPFPTRKPRISNIVRLWFGTWKLVALVAKKLKERHERRG